LIVDGHPIHKSLAVSRFVAATEGRLQLFYLPPYSPEFNPDEQVWNHLKNHRVGIQPVTGPDQLRQLIISHLRKVQKLPFSYALFLVCRKPLMLRLNETILL
jgi:transposase